MKKAFIAFACLLFVQLLAAQTVSLQYSKASLQETYAAGKLSQALLEKRYTLNEASADYVLQLIIDPALGAEAFSIKPAGKKNNNSRW